ncbi:hypothetical protein [Actinotalea sp. Marseille-Q4924]|uniref:hypothetical protein n=1 Tax=Actinotalea sp. Marseille-Q4924 TaxID=2866571 RepID=UPI001CE4231B|nr:hypothetical protein [Actinotalea sp. Marseille-Q4924]
MTTQTPNANDVLMGGGGAPSWKFTEPGTTRTGVIKAPPQAHQEKDYDPNNPGGGKPKFYPSGDPIMGITVEVQTDDRDPGIEDDDGARTFWIEGRYLKDAVRAAVRAAGANGLQVGGRITVTFTHREDPMDKRSRKYWDVQYVPAGNAALMTGDATPAPAPAPAAPAAQAPAAAAPVPAPPGDTPADKARALIAVGLDDTTIGAAVGLDASVVAIIRSSAA